MTKEQAMERFMDHMIRLQKSQIGATFTVAQAVARMDTSKEILPFSRALQDFDLINKKIEEAEDLKSAWERAR
tara:strand:- start:153 stop:371 length:219 start_codon:yes stop_codon:yes gene_type:complete